MSLDTQGILSAVTLAIYVPVLFFAVRVCVKYGIRERGWLLLVIFSLIRIIGGALLVAAELITPVVTGLYIGGYALEASGLSPLLLSTLGLIEVITEGPNKEQRYARHYRILHLIGIVALILMIVGISTTSSSSQSTANTERRVGVILFVALYVILVAIIAIQWSRRNRLMKYRSQLLVAVSAALPFLAVRTLYSLLSTFSSSSFLTTTGSTTTTDSNNALAEFNMFTGKWQIYVAMELVMEYIVMLIYVFSGTVLRLDQDYKLQDTEADEYPLHPPQY